MGDPAQALSVGMLQSMAAGDQVDGPVLQCLQIKPMNSNTGAGAERYRVVMSDSINFIQGMLAQQINYLVTDNVIQKGSICRLSGYQTNQVKDKLILVVLGCDVLPEYGQPDKIGTPTGLDPPKEEEAKAQPGNIAGNNFYGQKPQQQQAPQQQQKQLPSRTNGSKGGHAGHIQPIEALSPYAHKWTIKVRCTSKSDIKTWHNKNGEGKLFSVNLLDESGEIRATGFNDAVDSWYDVFQENQVYYISSPAKVQLAKKQFSNLNNDYEITFERDTQVEKAEDMDGVPQIRYNFTSIENIQNVDKDATIDVIGVLRDVGETSEIVSKTTQKPYQKRELTIADDTGYDIRLTVWGKTADAFDVPVESVIAFKGVKVSDFGGRSLSLLASGTMTADPDIDEAHKLKGWYDAAGPTQQFQTHANTMSAISATNGGRKDDTKTVEQIEREDLGMNEEKPDYFNLKATTVFVRNETWNYPACQGETCNKKVIEVNPGEWRCEKCDKTYERPQYRYIMSINVSDHTGQIWLSCFNETGEQLMGMTADDLVQLQEEGNDTRVKEVFSEANCKSFIFRIRAKLESYQDTQSVRFQVQNSSPVNYAQEAKKLADLIKQYSIEDDNTLFVN